MNDDSKLKPCPFCGSNARLYGNKPGYPGAYESFYVQCDVCNIMTYDQESEKDAVSVWNRRINTDG